MTKVRLPPIGFWSYARQDDQLSQRKRLNSLRMLLMAELQQLYGRDTIQLFQDITTIPHGAAWEREIKKALNKTIFFIPIITPNFIQSGWCCREVIAFIERQRQLFSIYPDLPEQSHIFPILYIDISEVDPADPQALEALEELQWFDFRAFRHRNYEDEPVQQALSEFAESICNVLHVRVEAPLTAEERARLRAEEDAELALKAEAQRQEREAAEKEEAERKAEEEAAEAARRRELEVAEAARRREAEQAEAARIRAEKETAATRRREEKEAEAARLRAEKDAAIERRRAEKEEEAARLRDAKEIEGQERKRAAELAAREEEREKATASDPAVSAYSEAEDVKEGPPPHEPPASDDATDRKPGHGARNAGIAAAMFIVLALIFWAMQPMTAVQNGNMTAVDNGEMTNLADTLEAPWAWLYGDWREEDGDCSDATRISGEGNQIRIEYHGQQHDHEIDKGDSEMVKTKPDDMNEQRSYYRQGETVKYVLNDVTFTLIKCSK